MVYLRSSDACMAYCLLEDALLWVDMIYRLYLGMFCADRMLSFLWFCALWTVPLMRDDNCGILRFWCEMIIVGSERWYMNWKDDNWMDHCWEEKPWESLGNGHVLENDSNWLWSEIACDEVVSGVQWESEQRTERERETDRQTDRQI